MPHCNIHLLVKGHLCGLNFLAIVHRVVMHIAEQVSVEQDVKSFGHMPRSRIAGSLRFFCFALFFNNSPHQFP